MPWGQVFLENTLSCPRILEPSLCPSTVPEVPLPQIIQLMTQRLRLHPGWGGEDCGASWRLCAALKPCSESQWPVVTGTFTNHCATCGGFEFRAGVTSPGLRGKLPYLANKNIECPVNT